MKDAKLSRLRRSRQTRLRIAQNKALRLSVFRSNSNIYAQIIDGNVGKVLVTASTLEGEVKKDLANGGNAKAAAMVGKRIAEKAKTLGIQTVAFDRSGYRYHGRIKALADAAREHGLSF